MIQKLYADYFMDDIKLYRLLSIVMDDTKIICKILFQMLHKINK